MIHSTNSKRIAKNIVLLYFRTLLSMLISLYTSRVVLSTLGIEDFGIYNVVGGLVVLFSFLNAAMSSATQRYFSFELGLGNNERFRQIFSIAINIHFFLAILITLLAETFGLWFLNNRLNIPIDKIVEANWVFQFSIASFFLTVVSVPYNAAIISHERMQIYAYVSIFEVSVKLLIVYLLVIITENRLVWYAGMLFGITCIVRMIYGIYCKKQIKDCSYVWVKDRVQTIEMMYYAGWNLFGNLAAVGFTQGLNILLNIFFGPVANAANGIANQVNGAVSSFIVNFQVALNPQIVKSYASEEKEYMQFLVFSGSRYSFYLLLLLTVPIVSQTDYILHLWLGNVPEYTVVFTQLILINALINTLSGTLMTAAQATGKIKIYQSIVGGILLLNVPVSYFVLKTGSAATVVLIVMIAISVLALLVRLIILNYMNTVSFILFMKHVLVRVITVSVLVAVIVYICYGTGFLRNTCSLQILLMNTMIIETITVVIITFIGLKKSERKKLFKKILQQNKQLK